MIRLIPNHWLDNKQIPEIVNAIQPEIDKIQNAIEDFYAQLFIDTATWSLDYWERDYGLTQNANDTLENRRNAVKVKMRGNKTATLSVLQSIVDAYGGNTQLSDTGHEVHIKYIEPSGVPKDLSGMLTSLREVAPAHIPFSSERVYQNPKASIYISAVPTFSARILIKPKPKEVSQSG